MSDDYRLRVYRYAPELWCVQRWRQGDRVGRTFCGTWEQAMENAQWWVDQTRIETVKPPIRRRGAA